MIQKPWLLGFPPSRFLWVFASIFFIMGGCLVVLMNFLWSRGGQVLLSLAFGWIVLPRSWNETLSPSSAQSCFPWYFADTRKQQKIPDHYKTDLRTSSVFWFVFILFLLAVVKFHQMISGAMNTAELQQKRKWHQLLKSTQQRNYHAALVRDSLLYEKVFLYLFVFKIKILIHSDHS